MSHSPGCGELIAITNRVNPTWSVEKISKYLGCAVEIVRSYLPEQNLIQQSVILEQKLLINDDDLCILYQEKGLTLQAIGELFDVTRQRVHQRMVKAGILRRRNGRAYFVRASKSFENPIYRHEIEPTPKRRAKQQEVE